MGLFDQIDPALRRARGVIADLEHHSDASAILACDTVIRFSMDRDERIHAKVLRVLLVDGVAE